MASAKINEDSQKGQEVRQQNRPLLFVHIISLYKTQWRGRAIAIAGVNAIGPFSVLPEHANFVSYVQGDVTVVTPDKQRHTVPVKRGILHCQENVVRVFSQLPLEA